MPLTGFTRKQFTIANLFNNLGSHRGRYLGRINLALAEYQLMSVLSSEFDNFILNANPVFKYLFLNEMVHLMEFLSILRI